MPVTLRPSGNRTETLVDRIAGKRARSRFVGESPLGL